MASLFPKHLSRWSFPMVKSLQSRNGISLRANLEAQSNIQSHNAVMNPIGKTRGLFVNGFVRWRNGRKCWIKRVRSECYVWPPYNLGCYKPRSLQKLETKLWNEKCLKSQNVSSHRCYISQNEKAALRTLLFRYLWYSNLELDSNFTSQWQLQYFQLPFLPRLLQGA